MDCPSSTLMAGLWKDPFIEKSNSKGINRELPLGEDGTVADPYSWLRNITILLQGQS